MNQNKPENIAVVGSGAVGLFAVKALLEKGHKVTLIDTGIPANALSSSFLELPKKSLFNKSYQGSFLSLAQAKSELPKLDKIVLSQSYVQGGLANIWGKFNSRYNNNQMAKLESFYGESFSKYLEIANNFLKSKVYQSSLEIKSITSLEFSYPQLSNDFDMDFYKNEFSKNHNFTYLNDYFFQNLKRENKEILIQLKAVTNNKIILKSFDRLFLATGQLSTINILKRSANLIPSEFTIKTHDYILSPIRFADKNHEQEILGSLNYKNLIHAQIYGPNSFLVKERREKIVGPFLKNFGILQIFLDSNLSKSIRVKINNEKIECFESEAMEESKPIIHEFESLLYKNRKKLSFTSFPKFLYTMKTGSSHHNYGALEKHSLDINTHIIDSSVLPYVPAGSILQITLANAARIIDHIYEN